MENTVYLGGVFRFVNNWVGRNYAAAVDATTGIVTAWDPEPDNYVYALTMTGGSLYMGGSFSSVLDQTIAPYFAPVDSKLGAIMTSELLNMP